LTNKLWQVRYIDLVEFDVITAGVKFKHMLVWSKSKIAVDTKDSSLGIEEPPSTELELQILILSLDQLE
jgi:hypothetical protein